MLLCGTISKPYKCIIAIGFDLNANPVEILYNVLEDDGVNVFHAMPCQKKFYHLLEGGERP